MARITVESFGSNLPRNWEEIADFLNNLIEEKADDSKEAVEEIWENYCAGNIKGAPEPITVESEAEILARKIRESGEWDTELLRELCDLAGLSQEWEEADGESFESVAYKAAEILGVEI